MFPIEATAGQRGEVNPAPFCFCSLRPVPIVFIGTDVRLFAPQRRSNSSERLFFSANHSSCHSERMRPASSEESAVARLPASLLVIARP